MKLNCEKGNMVGGGAVGIICLVKINGIWTAKPK